MAYDSSIYVHWTPLSHPDAGHESGLWYEFSPFPVKFECCKIGADGRFYEIGNREVTNRLKSTQSGVTTHVELSDLEA